MLDFQAWIEKKLGKWTWRELGATLAIVLLALVAFDVARALKPTKAIKATGAGSVVKRWLHRDDPRGFMPAEALGPKRGADDGLFDIAWISGSPISIRKTPAEWRLDPKRAGYEMTDVLGRYLKEIGGTPVRVQEFLLQGVRSGDMRRGILFAASQPEIDFYVVEVNPIWMLNDFLQYTLSRQRAVLLGLEGLSWTDYAAAARLLRAHEIGLEAVSAIVPGVRDRYRLFGAVAVTKAIPFPFRKSAAVVNDGAMMLNWMAWIRPDVLAVPIVQPAAKLRRYRDLMMMGDLSLSGFGMRTFVENVRTLAATGKPAILFMPPMNPQLKQDPAAARFVEDMAQALRKAFDEVGATNVTLVTDKVWSEPSADKFLDVVHLKHGQSVIDTVVGLIEQRVGKPFVRRPLSEVYVGGAAAKGITNDTAREKADPVEAEGPAEDTP